MRLEISAGGLRVTPKERAYVERRLGFALGRFGDRVGLVRVRLTGDLNGTKAAMDKRCLLKVRVWPSTNVLVEATARRFSEAVDCLAERAARAVCSAIERRRDGHRRRSSI